MGPLGKARRDGLWTLLLTVASAAVLLSAFGLHFFPVKSDELTVAWMGKQAALGRLPYVDFFCFVPPLTLYGLAAVFKVLGASLGAFRLVTLFWLLGLSFVLDRLFVRAGVPRPWAAAAAFLFPGLFLTFWPVASHHWFALGFGLAGLWAALAAGEAGAPLLRYFAGVLAGCSGLCLQTEGALYSLLAAGLLGQSGARPVSRRNVLWLLAGVASPLLLFSGLLAIQGSLGKALYCLVTWPAKYYKQPGGFNDLDILASVASEWAKRWSAPWTLNGVASLLTFAAAVGFAVWAPLCLAMSPAWTDPDRRTDRRNRWLFALSGLLFAWAIFLGGRAEWVHLTLFLPLMAWLAAWDVEWSRERWRPVIFKGLVAFALAASALRWASVWSEHPPLLADILRVDAAVRENSIPSALKLLPRTGGQPPAVVFLPHGADLYFYWAPDPPPVDWVEPPSFKYNAPGDFEALAAFLDQKRIPFVLIQGDFAAMFLSQPSPIQRVLSERYRPLRRTPLGLIIERIPDVPPAR